MDNPTLIKIGGTIIVVFMLWLMYLIIRNLKGGSIGIEGGDVYEFLRR